MNGKVKWTRRAGTNQYDNGDYVGTLDGVEIGHVWKGTGDPGYPWGWSVAKGRVAWWHAPGDPGPSSGRSSSMANARLTVERSERS